MLFLFKIISKILKEYFIISIFLFLKKGGTNSIILLIFSFVDNNDKENLDSIICNNDKQLNIDDSLFENAAKE